MCTKADGSILYLVQTGILNFQVLCIYVHVCTLYIVPLPPQTVKRCHYDCWRLRSSAYSVLSSNEVGLTNFVMSQTIFTSTVTSKICKKCLQLFRRKIIKSFKTCSQLYTFFTFFPVLFSLYWLGSEFILQLF